MVVVVIFVWLVTKMRVRRCSLVSVDVDRTLTETALNTKEKTRPSGSAAHEVILVFINFNTINL